MEERDMGGNEHRGYSSYSTRAPLRGILPPKMSAPRRAKLVCTLGPACDSLDGLRGLINAGMDVARFNFSHGTHAEHGERLARLRQASDLEHKSVAALQDLCGPKIR